MRNIKNKQKLKTVLITGACGGLGGQISTYFANKGWQVIATVHHLDAVKGLNIHQNIKFYSLDVTSTESIEAAKKEIVKDFKTIDVVINNAGKGYRSFAELSKDSEIESVVQVNWLGVVRCVEPLFRFSEHKNSDNLSTSLLLQV